MPPPFVRSGSVGLFRGPFILVLDCEPLCVVECEVADVLVRRVLRQFVVLELAAAARRLQLRCELRTDSLAERDDVKLLTEGDLVVVSGADSLIYGTEGGDAVGEHFEIPFHLLIKKPGHPVFCSCEHCEVEERSQSRTVL